MDGIEFCNSITAKEYNALRKSTGWNTVDYEQASAGLANSVYIAAARYNGRAVGFARLISDGGYSAFIPDVIVGPEFRGNGIGSELVSILVRRAEAGLKSGQSMFIGLVSEYGRERFYQRIGFSGYVSGGPISAMARVIHK